MNGIWFYKPKECREVEALLMKLRRTYGPPPSRLQTAGLLGTAAFGASCALWGTIFTLGEFFH